MDRIERVVAKCAFTLRPWREGDAASLARHANDYGAWRNLRDRFPHPYTRDDARMWVRMASSRVPPTDFAIVVEGEAVGGVGFMLHDDVERVSAEIGYWLGAAFRGRGIMRAAVRAATEHAFGAYGLTRVYALPFTRNHASIRVLEHAGYRREGVLRRSAVKEGEVLDQAMYAITDHDLWPDAAATPAAR
jgi:RimJ/RimL family protein N-acetyltransferase